MRKRTIPNRVAASSSNITNARSSGFRAGLRLLICSYLLLIISQRLPGQQPGLNITLRDTTVEAVLDLIRSSTDINFIYNHEEIENSPLVSVAVMGATVEEVLEQCLAGTGLTYQKVNNTVIIIPVKGDGGNDTPAPVLRRGILKGRVIDRDSRMPLPYATVVVMNTDPIKGATTNEQGDFRIENIPVGRHSIRISYVGYEDLVLPEIFIGSSREVEITATMTERSESIGEVMVNISKGEPLNQMAMVSSKSFSVEETKRYAASITDPARMVQVFAGVSVNDDATNEIVIRGNSPNWLLWRLEGVEIPSPNHFSEEGYTSGSVSILSSDMLSTSDFYTGAFPAEFGNALSGVFDLKLRNGNNDRHEFSAQAGVLGIDFSAEGPFKKGYRGSYLVNYRYSTLSLINDMHIQVSKNSLPNYQDISFKINLPTRNAGTFSIWSLGGLSDDKEKYLPDTIAGENPEKGYRDYTRSGMYAAGVTHTIYPDEKSYIRSVFSQSYNFSGEKYEFMDSLGHLNLRLEDELKNRAIRISTLYNRKFSSRVILRTGLTLNRMNFDFNSILVDTLGIHNTIVNGTGSAILLQGYLQTKFRLSENLLITSGLHYAWFELSREHSFEPRIGVQFTLPGKQRISFGYGIHSKNENLPVYFVELEQEDGSVIKPNIGLKMTRSSHFVLGYEKLLGSDIQIKMEAYYQKIVNLPVPTNPGKYWSPIFGGIEPYDSLTNKGKGRNYGLELTLQKFFTQGYYGMITASIFDSKYMPADGQWHNTRYNCNYIFNLVAGKEFMWGDHRMIGLNSKVIWTGGKRVIPLDLEASIAKGEAVYKNDEIYSRKTPDYFRIDFALNIHFFKRRKEHIISLDIQNVSNRRNVYAEEYDPETKSMVYYPLAGIIPILNYRFEF